MMKRVILVIFLLVFVFIASEDAFTRKNPFFAGSLSWYYPGLGQFYNGKPLKGVIFFATESLLVYTGINHISDITFKLEEGVIVTPHSEITSERRTLSIVLLSALGVLHIYNIVDSISDSIKLNLEFGDNIKAEKANPVFLGIASYIMPGTGQMFNGEHRKGSELIFYQLFFRSWKLYLDYDLRERYESPLSIINWNDLNSNDRLTLASYYILHTFFRLYCAWDAYSGGNKDIGFSMGIDSKKNSILLFGLRF